MSTATITPFKPNPPATNAEFLRWIAPHDWQDLWMAVFRGDPKTVDRSEWAGGRPSRMLGFAAPTLNNYFTVSSFVGLNHPGDRVRRDEAHWHRLHVLTLDDVGPTNDPAACLILLGQPSYRFETSPGNEQWGYVLDPPWDDRVTSAKLLGALWKHLTPNADPGQGNITRYQRLPYGSNGKAVYSPPVATRINVWTGRRLDRAWAQALAAALGVEEPFVAAPGAGGAGGVTTPVAPVTGASRVVASSAALRKAGSLDPQQDPVFRAMERLGMIQGGPRTSPMGPWTFDIHCPWEHEHTGKVSTGTVYVPVRAKFKCQHGHCVDKTNEHVRLRIDEMLRDTSGGSQGLVHEEFPDPVDPATVPLPLGPATPSVPGSTPGWEQRLVRAAKTGNLVANSPVNIDLFLKNDTHLAGAFQLDEFAHRVMVLVSLPGTENDPTETLPRGLVDEDVTVIQRYLATHGLTVSFDHLWREIMACARGQRFHPVRDWLKGLRWDGKPRLARWLVDYAGAADTEYHRAVGAWLLMGMVARVCEPGCQMDYMMILEGRQGGEKSKLLATLAKPWFSDMLADVTTRDASILVEGCWLIEVAEMDRYDRTTNAAMKAFLTRTEEHYRPMYGRAGSKVPRQCVFVGTTNEHVYLRDHTGNRRMWPVRTGRVNIAGLRRDKEQLFAEAYCLQQDIGLPYWPTRAFEKRVIEPEQQLRMIEHAWTPNVMAYLKGKPHVVLTNVLSHCTGGGHASHAQQNLEVIRRIMTELGWYPQRSGVARWWYPPTK